MGVLYNNKSRGGPQKWDRFPSSGTLTKGKSKEFICETRKTKLTIHYCSTLCPQWFTDSFHIRAFGRFISTTPLQQQLGTSRVSSQCTFSKQQRALGQDTPKSNRVFIGTGKSTLYSSVNKDNKKVWRQAARNVASKHQESVESDDTLSKSQLNCSNTALYRPGVSRLAFTPLIRVKRRL